MVSSLCKTNCNNCNNCNKTQKNLFRQKKPFEKVAYKQKISYFCNRKTKRANVLHESL